MIKTFSKYLLSLSILLIGVAGLYANHHENGNATSTYVCYLQSLEHENNVVEVEGLEYFKSNSSDSEKHKEYEEKVTEEEFEEHLTSSKKSLGAGGNHFTSLLSAFLSDFYHLEQSTNCFYHYKQFFNHTNQTPLYIRFCVYRL